MSQEISEIIKDKELLGSKPAKSHLIRFHMYREIEAVLKKMNPSGIGLTIADWEPIINTMMPDVKFYNLRYPDYDIQDMKGIPDNSVDVFYSEMVIEHIPTPQKAIDETYRILKPGGIGIHTTVFIMPYHPSPIDLWRFSPELLKMMHKDFSEVHTGGWGNWRGLAALLMRLTRMKVTYPTGNLLSGLIRGKNEKYMITTYAIARK